MVLWHLRQGCSEAAKQVFPENSGARTNCPRKIQARMRNRERISVILTNRGIKKHAKSGFIMGRKNFQSLALFRTLIFTIISGIASVFPLCSKVILTFTASGKYFLSEGSQSETQSPDFSSSGTS